MLDLSALEGIDLGNPAPVADGTPKQIPLTDILEDPDQPRVEFPEDQMQKMVESIKARGVKTPISVKPHPTEQGKWIINYGARRFRASVMAGKETIPAFVDNDHDDYDQVMENKERLNHSPIELALFIQKKIKQGEKKNVIAKKLNEDPVFISTHLALVDMPECLSKAYDAGFKSPKTLYDLRKLWESFPEEVNAWVDESLENGQDIIRSKVQALSKKLKEPKQAEATEADPESEPQAQESQEQTAIIDDNESFNFNGNDQAEATEELEVKKLMDQSNQKEQPEAKEEDPDKIKKPLLVVIHDGRQANLMLNKKPSSLGFAWIKYEDGTEVSVDCSSLEIEYLQEA
ncbi:ParB/RepB/Spo0J family partition protein [Acinetobacter radioresistens]|jgi:ParB family transcriptional regulator, chromosome partitioning protein|uniref:Chromosome partitioning protein ParB n=4 Tax=Bacteria TaxID=2 RepID=A0A1A7RE36_9GAMM|nr:MULTISPECIES: ParB/RepB/Spo0J family partition protein [Acinetobacter]ACI02874.1 KorB [uncultured bacterium HHV216]ACI02928.1 KorB [uncultured bacterium HH1107]RDC52091.1 ParB/RepB/Spo0J family partition protein [Acinetobacter sp. RIT592]KAB0623142.1 ParB/RepB/Spo0J family partition protein [Acinetobacter gandensis]MBD8010217.1 ParB/RepB/Spo0J family partition protein [Acinetobacter pecorum]